MSPDPASPALVGLVHENHVTEEWQYKPRPEVIRLEDVPSLLAPQAQEPIRCLPDFGPDWWCSCSVQELPGGRLARVLTQEPRIDQRQSWIVVQVPLVHEPEPGSVVVTEDRLLPTPSSPVSMPGDEVWPLWSVPPGESLDHKIDGLELAVRLTHRDAVLVRVGRSFGLVFPPGCSLQMMVETFVVAGFLPPVELGLDPWHQTQEAVWLAHFRAQAQSAAAQKLGMEMASRRYRDMFGVAPQQRLAELQAGR